MLEVRGLACLLYGLSCLLSGRLSLCSWLQVCLLGPRRVCCCTGQAPFLHGCYTSLQRQTPDLHGSVEAEARGLCAYRCFKADIRVEEVAWGTYECETRLKRLLSKPQRPRTQNRLLVGWTRTRMAVCCRRFPRKRNRQRQQVYIQTHLHNSRTPGLHVQGLLRSAGLSLSPLNQDVVCAESLRTGGVRQRSAKPRFVCEKASLGNHDAVVYAESLVRRIDTAAAVPRHNAHHLLQSLVAPHAPDNQDLP